jgi:DNA transformation protein
MTSGDSFKDFVEDQLSGLYGLSFRAMFGGHGMYRGAVFFGILFEDRLYFKTDDTTRPDYAGRGMKCFQPSKKQKLKNYMEVPADILEDREQLLEWAVKACGIA